MFRHGVPDHVRSYNGAEMRADRVRKWLASLRSKPMFIEPGSPWETATANRSTASPGQVFEWRDLLLVEGNSDHHRAVAGTLQHPASE